MVDFLGPGAFDCARPAATRPTHTPGNLPGDLPSWFKDCSSPLARDGTEWRSSWLNHLIANLRSLVGKSGVPLTNLDDDVITRAVRSQGLNYIATVGGTANALTATLDPAITGYDALIGTPLRVRIATTNTGAATISLNGLVAVNILARQKTALQAGDLTAGCIVTVVYDGTQFVIEGGRSGLSGEQFFTASGTFVPGAGVTRIKVRLWGGGGGGGGAGGSTASGGGAGGGYSEGIFSVTPGASYPVTIGAGGAGGGGAPTVGQAGGTTSFGSLLSATGGGAGQLTLGQNGVGAGVGGQVNLSGYPGIGGSGTIGGTGGTAALGAGCTPVTTGTGVGGTFPGGGGSGAYNSAAGGPGAGGLAIVEW